MTTEEATQLRPDTTVMWDNDPDDLGTVCKLNYGGFLVRWDNGQEGWIDCQDAARIKTYTQPRQRPRSR